MGKVDRVPALAVHLLQQGRDVAEKVCGERLTAKLQLVRIFDSVDNVTTDAMEAIVVALDRLAALGAMLGLDSLPLGAQRGQKLGPGGDSEFAVREHLHDGVGGPEEVWYRNRSR